MMHRPLDFGETLYYVRNLKAGNHCVFFYRNPQEKHEVVFNFLQAGLEKGERAVYVASQETPKQIRKHMENFGLNVKTLEKDDVLKVFDYNGCYMIDGKVNITQTLAFGKRMYEEAMEIGLKGLRGCGEAACFFEHNKERELMDYERMIGKKFDLPIIALCAYDVNHTNCLAEKFFFDVIKAHGPVVTHSFAQEVEFENFFPTVADGVLEAVFGEIGRRTILKMLEEHHSLTLDEIAEDPQIFFDSLEEIVGSGAQVITKSVTRQMHSKLGIA